MPISTYELKIEKQKLQDTIKVIRKRISALGSELYDQEDKILEFKKFLWDSHTEMDPGEMKVMMSNNDVEISIMMRRGEYLKKLYKIQNKPYFGRIVFASDDGEQDDIYIGITHVLDDADYNYYVHDWRSPICSMFYDYELGQAHYEAPEGLISGYILKKRQYTIENAKLVHVFDNNINIDDELLQEVLATESSDKMKNIVNTIQREQNNIIRNVVDKNLVVQGIAGSGKTSVALHRIAFLLYKIAELSSLNVLIFSPNKVFSEYISNVLPELGEENVKETSIQEFLLYYLKEFKKIESFSSFIERYYQTKNINDDLIKLTKYKLSDDIVDDINKYINNIILNCKFNSDIVTKDVFMEKERLNELLHERYKHFPLFRRLDVIAEKICDWFYLGKYNKKSSILKTLYTSLNIDNNYITIYNEFFKSTYSKINITTNSVNKNKMISYEDATIFVYMKSLLSGVDYNTNIKQVVIDEAQDYTKTQYLLLFSIFKNANYTILGDVNQTVNPYYKYNSLEIIKELLPSSNYLCLNKTYRSSEEIINYTNKILDLRHVSAIRRSEKCEVITRECFSNIKESLLADLEMLKTKYKSVAIVTKMDYEADKLYELLYKETGIIKIGLESVDYQRHLVVLPAYIAKGLEFDAVIVYTDSNNFYTDEEKNLFYVACTRAQHQLIVYNQNN